MGIFASGLGGSGGLAFDSVGNLYVADVRNGVIQKYSSSGTDLGIFASTGIVAPLGIAFNSAGNLFVANSSGGGSSPFTGTIREFSSTGADMGVFASGLLPAGIAIDRDGNLFVANADSTIRKFSATGTNLGIFATTAPDFAPYFLTFGPDIHAVPEPTSFALFGLGGIGLAFFANRRRQVNTLR